MNRLVFALLEILAAGVFLLPVYALRCRGRMGAACLVSSYLVAVWSLAGLPTVLYSRFYANLNLIPFMGMGADLRNCLLNVALFVPLGLLLPSLWRKYRQGRAAALFGLGLSLFVELAQLFTMRATDVNDLITNTAGTCLGWALWAVAAKVWPGLRPREDRAPKLGFLCLATGLVMFFPQPYLAAWLWDILA